MVIDKLNQQELTTIREISIKQATVDNAIKNLINTRMELDIEFQRTYEAICRNHSIGITSEVYQITTDGNIIIN
jgi:hypothetical protein